MPSPPDRRRRPEPVTAPPRAKRPNPPEPDFDPDEPFLQRILPRTILGLSSLLFFMALAAAFSGAVLFAYYRFELDDTQQRVADVEASIADQVESGRDIIAEDTDAAVAEINGLLDELEQFAASGQTLDELVSGVKDSVYFISTLDENGQPSVGTAFVLFSDSERSYLLTSYTTVRAATASPGPSISARNGGSEVAVTLNNWDAARDLALLVAEDAPNLPAVEVGADTPATGDRVFAISGLGAQGASVVQGVISDVAANAIAHDAPIGVQFQGGPLLDSSGKLVGVASRAYAPAGFSPQTVFFGVPVSEVCVEAVQCPAGFG